MATLRWTGSVDGDLNKTGNYLLLSGGSWVSATGIPASGDTLLLTQTSNSVDGSAVLDSVNLAELSAYPDFLGNFGSGSAAVQLGTTTALNWRSGGSAAYIDSATTTLNHEQSQGKRLYLTAGTTTTVNSASGYIHAGTGAVITNLYAARTEVEVSSNATAITLAYMGSGSRLRSDSRSVTTYVGVAGSSLETSGAVDSTTMIISGGSWNHMSRGTSASVLLMDRSVINVASTGEAATITALRQWPTARINNDLAGNRLTVSSLVTIGAQQYSGFSIPSLS